MHCKVSSNIYVSIAIHHIRASTVDVR